MQALFKNTFYRALYCIIVVVNILLYTDLAYSREKVTINNHTDEHVRITGIHAQYETELLSPEGEIIKPFQSSQTDLPQTYGYFTAMLRDSNSQPICRVLTQQGSSEHGEAYAIQLNYKRCCHVKNLMRLQQKKNNFQYRTHADWTFDVKNYASAVISRVNKNEIHPVMHNNQSQSHWNVACNDSPYETLSFQLDNQSSHRVKLRILEQHYLKLEELQKIENMIFLQHSVHDLMLHPFQLFEPGYYSINFGVFSISEQGEGEQFVCQYIINHPGYENFVTEVSDGVMSYLYPGYTPPVVKSDAFECTIANTDRKNVYRMIIRDRRS